MNSTWTPRPRCAWGPWVPGRWGREGLAEGSSTGAPRTRRAPLRRKKARGPQGGSAREGLPCAGSALSPYAVRPLPQAQRRLAALRGQGGGAPPPWHGHVHTGDAQLQQDSRHRPMDLRAVAGAAGGAADAAASPAAYGGASWEALLRVGSAIAAEARSAVRAEAGYRTSAGIACNKLLAKMCRCSARGCGQGGMWLGPRPSEDALPRAPGEPPGEPACLLPPALHARPPAPPAP